MSEKLQVQVEVSKEAYELGQALVSLVKAVKVAVADGFQVGQDVPVIVMAAMAELPKGIEGIQKLGEESKDGAAFAAAFGLAAKDLAGIFLSKEVKA